MEVCHETTTRLPMLFGSVLLVAGLATGCDEAAVTEPDGASANVAPNPGDPLGQRGLAGVHAGRNDPANASVPADILARVRSHLPEGFEPPAAPRRPEPLNVRMGTDARPVDRPGAVSPARSEDSHKEWHATLPRADAEASTESSLPPIEPQVICPPDQPPTGNCDPAPPPPPPPDPDPDPDPEPEPEPEPIQIVGVSYVDLWGFGRDGHSYENVDFGSYTAASQPLATLKVTGLSFIDGLLERVMPFAASQTAFVGVGWTYWAGFFGYAFIYEQEGVHQGCVAIIGGGEQCSGFGSSYDFAFDF